MSLSAAFSPAFDAASEPGDLTPPVPASGSGLTPPTLSDLEDWKREPSIPTEESWVRMHLQAAADLMSIATGLVEDPADALTARVVKRGIMDMAWYIGTSMEERDAEFSPFSSERIGSYSYSKATRSAQLGEPTGVPFFDLAVAYLGQYADGDLSGLPGSSSRHVMPETLVDYLNPNDVFGTDLYPGDIYYESGSRFSP